MKKIIIIVFAIKIFVITCAFAQTSVRYNITEDISWEIRFGVNLTTLSSTHRYNMGAAEIRYQFYEHPTTHEPENIPQNFQSIPYRNPPIYIFNTSFTPLETKEEVSPEDPGIDLGVLFNLPFLEIARSGKIYFQTGAVYSLKAPRYSSLEFPFFVSYRYNLFRKIDWDFHMGPYFALNISSGSTPDLVVGGNEIFRLSSGTRNYYQETNTYLDGRGTTTGWGFVAGSGFYLNKWYIGVHFCQTEYNLTTKLWHTHRRVEGSDSRESLFMNARRETTTKVNVFSVRTGFRF